jgi:hypothetical protein
MKVHSQAVRLLSDWVPDDPGQEFTIDPMPLHLAVHPITCSLGVPTNHFDVRFVGVAPPDAQPSISTESVDLAWWPVDALPAHSGTADDIGKQVDLATARLRGRRVS